MWTGSKFCHRAKIMFLCWGAPVISNAKEIRTVLSAERKLVWKCKLGDCVPIVPSETVFETMAAKEAHLRERHLAALYDLD